jgi:LDH2 family malate/lactate/ureidoglycolate dehydrogenase
MWKTLPCCELLSRTKTINELFNHLRHGQRRFDKTTKRLNCCIDNATTMGFDYLKICDSQANALALIKKEMRYHGGNPITLAAPLNATPTDPSTLSSATATSATAARNELIYYYSL